MFRDIKPAFGQSSTSTAFGGGFGSSNMNSPFGQSTFGKTTTSGFTAPAFGAASTSLFGNNASTSSGLFGSVGMSTPVFGQAPTTQSSGFGFGANATSNNLFGNQQNANTGLFGGTTASAFGQNKPAFGSFASPSTGLFGQQQQPQATSLFGQPAASSTAGLFGSGGFGNTPNQTLGTPIKFVPGTGTDTMAKGGSVQTINTRHHCITCMKEYESKSLEELRLEDYALNRKGPQQSTQQTGLFGASTQPSLFGSSTSTSAGGSSLFGENKPLFSGGTSLGFGSNTGVFGSTNQQAGSIFSKPGGFGAVTTTTASGFSFNTTTSANPFGTQPKPFGTVAPQTNLFGSTAAQTPAFGTQPSGFGAFGSQPNQSIGLFNQNKSPFTVNTTSTGFTFGQNTATNQTSNLFGKPATGTGFGTSSGFGTSTFGSGNMFGSNQSTSLFNQPSFGKPNTTGFSFGSQAAPSTSGLGTSLSLGGGASLFGSTANKPGGLFGSGTGMFGTSTGSFGNSTNFGLGSGLGTSMGLGNSLIGGTTTNTTPNQQGNLSVHEQILALASMPFGDTPLFRNLLPSASKSNDPSKPSSSAPHKVAQKSASISNQYKVSPRSTTKIRVKPVSATQLSKKALFDGLDEDVPAQLENFSPLRSTKRLVLKTKPVDAETTSANNISIGNSNSYQESDKENTEIIHDQAEDIWLLEKGCSPNSKEDQRLQDMQSSRKSVDLAPDVTELRMHKITKSSLNSDSINKERSNESSSGSEYFNVAEESQEVDETPPLRDRPLHPTGIVLTRVGYYTIPSLDDLTSLITDDGRCVVDNFTVGREGYGNVYFPDSFDVSRLNLDEIVHFRHKEVVLYPDDEKKPPISEGLNRRAQVTLDRVWPIDKSTHEPITNAERLQEMRYEDKLQRVCAKLQTRFLEYRPQTGSWVFKVEHFSKYGLSDSDEEEALPAAGSKQQKPGAPPKPGAPVPPLGVQQALSVKQIATKEDAGGLVGSLLPADLNDTPGTLVPVLLEEDQDMEDVPKHPLMDYPEGTLISSPTVKLARELGSSSHKLQLMKASFFMEDDISPDVLEFSQYENHLLRDNIEDMLEKDAQFTSFPDRRFSLLRSHFASPQPHDNSMDGADISRKQLHKLVATQEVIVPPVEHPKAIALKYPHQTLHWSETSSYRIGAKCIVDLNLFKGHGFRVGWGLNSTLVTLTTQQAASTQPLVGDLIDLGSYTVGRLLEDYSPCIVQRLRVTGGGSGYEENFCELVEGHLFIQLNNSDVIVEEDCPLWTPSISVDALHAHCDLAVDLANQEADAMSIYTRQVWELCVALWGKLPSLDTSGESNVHHTVMVRREAVSDWLENVIIPQVRDETARILGKSADPSDKEYHVPAVLSYLSAKNLKEACEQAQKNGDHYTVMLLSQMGGSQMIRQLVHRQLTYWEEVNADKLINKERLKMFMLVAGLPLFSSSHGTINVCENLEWKRCFALHLWYICSPVASVMDALENYDNSFKANDPKKHYARHPNPPYIDMDDDSLLDNEQAIYDLCYHLFKLYSSHSYPLDKLLNPATHTADPLDYRLSWLMYQVLTSLGFTHLSEYSAAHLHTSFALQLESQGLWHWAIFALLHLKNAISRKAAVLDMLGRHIELNDNDLYLDKEDFLTEKLKIPSKWIYEAKATLATVQQQYSKAAWYLIKAGHVNEGHEIIMKHIAADAIINENYEYLQRLLEPLFQADPVNSVSGWNNGGQILWDYIQVVSEIKRLVSNPAMVNSYQIEKLYPLLTSLCARINLLPCPTAKDRLCQSEIALRTAHLVRNVLQLQSGENTMLSRVLAHVVNQLPLPEDYTCDELNQVVRTVVTEFVEE